MYKYKSFSRMQLLPREEHLGLYVQMGALETSVFSMARRL